MNLRLNITTLAFVALLAGCGPQKPQVASQATETVRSRPAGPDSCAFARRHFGFAVMHSRAKLREDAERQFQEAVDIAARFGCADRAKYEYQFARKLQDWGELERARTHLLNTTSLKPDHKNANFRLYQFYYEDAEYDSAIGRLARVVAAEDNTSKLIKYSTQLAQLYEFQGQNDHALEQYRSLQLLEPDNPDHLRKIAAFVALQDPDAALPEYRRALAQTPDDVDLVKQVARLEDGAGNTQAALALWERLVELDPENQVEHLERILQMSEMLGDGPLRISTFGRLIVLKPNSFHYRIKLADFYLVEGEMTKAKREIDQGLKVAPTSAELHYMKGEYYFHFWKQATASEAGEERIATLQQQALRHYRRSARDPDWQSNSKNKIDILDPPDTDEDIFFQTGEE